MGPGDYGTWTANVSGGTSPYQYQWEYSYDCRSGVDTLECNPRNDGVWYQDGTRSTYSMSYTDVYSWFYLRVTVTDNNGTKATSDSYGIYFE